MAAPQRRLKDLGKVADGRIRKGWPVAAFGGPIKTVNTRTKGFHNPGNLCYRNAVLQSLLHTPEFFRYLDCEERCSTPGDGCVFCALRNLALRYWTTTVSEFPQDAVAMINTAMEDFPLRNHSVFSECNFLEPDDDGEIDMVESGQQDAHEYFTGIFNMLKHINDDDIQGVDDGAMDRLFRMRTKTTWKCDDCQHTHGRQDGDIGIQLGIPESNQDQTLDKCLRDHFKPEEIEGLGCDSQECDGTRGKRTRIPRIFHGPEILVMQLKRMRLNQETGFPRKVWTRVGIEDRLDLSDWSTEALKYQLIGIVAHKGSNLNAGHYVAMVRSPNGGGFFICNDESVGDDPEGKEEIFGPRKSKSKCKSETKSETKVKPERDKWQSYVIVYQKIGGKMAKCI